MRISGAAFALGYAAAAALVPLATIAMAAPAISQQRSGQNDFDWEFGTWTTNVRVLRNPLSGEQPKWVEYRGTSIVRPLLGGRANIVELSVKGPSGQIEGGSLRLYNPHAGQWSLNYANLGNGVLTTPVYGGFGGTEAGAFYGQDMVDGRAILVRFLMKKVSMREAHFEQAYSVDGGATWETNWIAVDTLR